MRTILLPLILLAAACTPDTAPKEPSTDEPDTSTATPDDTSADTDTEPACGNGVVEEGEDCDDGGESSTCDEDCTEVACGDKTLNRTAGEECDPPDDDETCLSDCTARVGNCHLPTPWEEIAASLADEAALPTLPGKNQGSEWEAPLPELLFHEIAPTSRSTDEEVTDETCDLPTFWDADRVSTGGFVPAEEEDDEDYCRVRASPGSGNDPILYFATRDPVGSIHVPVTGEPSWVQLRFPIPEGHRAVELDYAVNQARLFGSHPTECDEGDQDEHLHPRRPRRG